MTWKRIKNRIILLFLAVCGLFVFFSCASSSSSAEKNEEVAVGLIDSDFFEAETSSLRLRRGEDAVFLLSFEEGLSFGDCDYPDEYSVTTQDGVTKLTLQNVRYSCRVSITEKIQVSVIENELFTVQEDNICVRRGETVVFTLCFKEGFKFETCDYDDYRIDNTSGVTKLILHDVFNPCRINVAAAEINHEKGIYYYLNGGTFLSSEEKDFFYEEPYNLKRHLRANTSIGIDRIEREGYIQTGWNTAANGSGEHIGLGSRVTIPEEGFVRLYAEWKQCAPESDFSFEIKKEGAVLTAYKGATEVEELVLPRKVGGVRVIGIAENFGKYISGKALILPDGLKNIANRAFMRCNFEEITFFDGLENVSDNSFLYTFFKTWHINAEKNPSFQMGNDNAVFADKVDRLMLHKDDKKMIFFAGCSMSYGLDSGRVEKAFNGEYFIANMGVIGGTNASFQMDIITNFLKEGDIFIHAPEVGSRYQLMDYAKEAEYRMFITIEGNYDLLSYVDMTKISGAFTQFKVYNRSRREAGENKGGYWGYNENYNEYGDYIVSRPYNGQNKQLSEAGYYYEREYINEQSIAALREKYDKIKSQGAKVLFSFSPTNLNGLTEDMRKEKSWLLFEKEVIYGLEGQDVPLISSVTNYLYDGYYFYDQDYHLNDVGVNIRTEQLIWDIKSALNR